MAEIYLDNSATTKVLPQVVEAMAEACSQCYGNPSSLHGKGIEAEKLVIQARDVLAGALGAKREEIYFTSGGTESNNWAILGCVHRRRRRGNHIITTKIEHPSVLKVFQFLESNGYEVSYLDSNKEGLVDLAQLKAMVREDTVLVSVMHVNNETGAIQPIEEIGQYLKEVNPRIAFHVDAVQSFGKIALHPVKSGIDLMSLSSHKIHGPKGVGALFIRKGLGMDPLLLGGEQENRMRAGTENVPGIVGFGAAVTQVSGWLRTMNQIASLKGEFLERLQRQVPGVLVNGSLDKAVPNIINLSFPGIKGEVLVHYLEQSHIYVSTGSACHSRSGKGSHVRAALGVDDARLEGAIRVSFSHFNTSEEIGWTADKLAEAVLDLQRLR